MKSKKETRGRKSLPVDKRKPPQATVKINNRILPLVMQLKSNLKNKLLTDTILNQLFDVLNGNSEQQSSVFKNPDSVELVESLQDKIRILEAEKQLLENKVLEQDEALLKLVLMRDAERLKVSSLESQLRSESVKNRELGIME